MQSIRRFSYELILATICLVLCSSRPLLAQTDPDLSMTGVPPFSSFSRGPVDEINVRNLNNRVTIPVLSKTGKGISFEYALSYDGLIWTKVLTGGGLSGPFTYTWVPTPGWGWRGISEALIGYITYTSGTSTYCAGNFIPEHTFYYGFVYHDSLGTTHNFKNLNLDPSCPAQTRPSDQTLDGSDYTLTVQLTNQIPTLVSLLSRSGASVVAPMVAVASSAQKIVAPNGPGSISDRNGNVVSTTGSTFTDALGMTVLTVTGSNPVTYSYTSPAGPESLQVSYSNLIVATNFGCPSTTEYPPTAASLVTSITTPQGAFRVPPVMPRRRKLPSV